MILKPCLCEHASHFWGPEEPRTLSPNGNPNHPYGVKYNAKLIKPLKTVNGTFEICEGCATDCHWETFSKLN